MLNCCLINVRQHGIRTAKGQQRGLGKKPANLRKRALPAVAAQQPCHGQQPQRSAHQQHQRQPRQLEQRMRRRGRIVINQRRQVLSAVFGSMAAALGQRAGRQPRQHRAQQQRGQHHPRKRNVQSPHRYKTSSC